MSGDALGLSVLMLVGGILGLGIGASWLVEGASRLALRLGVKPMVVGLTVVGFGTSMPEFSVSVLAASHGSAGLSLGNAVGSNVMNLLLVLGTAALLAPLYVVGGKHTIRRDLLFGLAPAVALMVLAWDGRLERGAALFLLALFVTFIAVCLIQARGDDKTPAVVAGHPLRHLALTVLGIVVLVAGAESMVRGAVALARGFGMSETIIGLSIVAFGTSLPELATSVVASLRQQAEISVGNVLGSNVFNLGMVVGTAFAIRPSEVPAFVIQQDVPFLILATLVVAIVVLREGRISRRGGMALLALFAVYAVLLAVRPG